MTTRPVLVIGNKNYSSWSLRPWLLLRQFDVAFDEVRLPLDTPVFQSEIARWSPTLRVPVLHHGDLAVWDSLAICEYANEAFLHGRAWPHALASRAEARAVSAEMHAGFAALRRSMPMNARRRVPGFRLPDDARPDVERIEELWRGCRQRHAADGDFLFGAFSIADAMYAPVALRLVTYDVTISDCSRTYVEALLALPAMRQWLADAEAETEIIAQYEAVR